MRHHGPLFHLNRSAFVNGKLLGAACRPGLRRRVAAMRRMQKKLRLPERLLAARRRDFARLLRQVAPHWLEEARGLAVGAGVSRSDILLLNCPPPELPAATNNCTTFVAVGKRENRLFKIRDERNHPQQFVVYRQPRRLAFQAGRDIGNLGVAHAWNACAVAGANNTGSETLRVGDEPRLNDCHMLRYFAERARTVEDIPRLFERLAEAGAAGGAGPGRGCIFIFADMVQGLILETAGEAAAVIRVRRGSRTVANHYLSAPARKWEAQPPRKNSLIRERRLRELLAGANGWPSLREIFAFSRDRKSSPQCLCNDDRRHFWMTLSVQLQVIDRRDPRASRNYVCCGNPRHSVFLPAPLDLAGVCAPLANGRLYREADRLYQRHRCNGHFRKRWLAFEKAALDGGDFLRLARQAYRLLCAET